VASKSGPGLAQVDGRRATSALRETVDGGEGKSPGLWGAGEVRGVMGNDHNKRCESRC